jgi:nucleoside phosphorylase
MDLAKNFQKFGIGIENMEFFAFLRVAQEFDIPAGGIFVVTNYTDENAHADFTQNHKLAMDKLANYIDERMTKLFEVTTQPKGM